MKKQDLLSILITFAVGFFGGVFLYTTSGAAKIDSEIKVPEEQQLSEFSIVSDVYGGCQLANVCPSFRILNDGSYRYYHTPRAGAEQVLREGTLPLPLQQMLHNTLSPTALMKESRPIEPALCNSFTDGVDIKYEITLDGVVYEINSCGTAVDDNGALWRALGEVWDYFETGGNN